MTLTLSTQIFERSAFKGQKWLCLLLQLLDIAKEESVPIGHSWQKSPEIESFCPISQCTFLSSNSEKGNEYYMGF